MLHLDKVRSILNSHEPIDSIVFYKMNGELVIAENVVCTSSYHKGNTFKIKWLNSFSFRDVKAFLIIELNGEEVYL